VRRHDLDLVSLVAGALFVFVAAAYLLAELSDHRVDGEWVFPGLLVGLGVLGLVASLWGGRPRDVAQQEPSEEGAHGPDPGEPAEADTDDSLADTLVEPTPERTADEDPPERP
jgi:hypothetical protein